MLFFLECQLFLRTTAKVTVTSYHQLAGLVIICTEYPSKFHTSTIPLSIVGVCHNSLDISHPIPLIHSSLYPITYIPKIYHTLPHNDIFLNQLKPTSPMLFSSHLRARRWCSIGFVLIYSRIVAFYRYRHHVER